MTREQTRAAQTFEHVSALDREAQNLVDNAGPEEKGKAELAARALRTRYGTFAHKLPALLRTAGLCQALHFLDARDKAEAERLLSHLASQLRRIDPEIEPGPGGLLARVRSAPLHAYLRLSREALAVAIWYSRLSRSVLKVEPGADEDRS